MASNKRWLPKKCLNLLENIQNQFFFSGHRLFFTDRNSHPNRLWGHPPANHTSTIRFQFIISKMIKTKQITFIHAHALPHTWHLGSSANKRLPKTKQKTKKTKLNETSVFISIHFDTFRLIVTKLSALSNSAAADKKEKK